PSSPGGGRPGTLCGRCTLGSNMKLTELVDWLDDYLAVADYPDIALNGLQVEAGTEVSTVAVAVDSSLSTMEQAAALGADLLLVHHGLFWGEPKAIAGAHGRRVKFLLERGISLYASHIPLDAHREVGNNWGFARRLGMEDLADFGKFRGMPVGVKGRLPDPLERRELAQMIEAQLGE